MTLQEKRDQIEAYLLQLGYAVKINWNNVNHRRLALQFLIPVETIRTSEKYNFTYMDHWQYHWDKLMDFGDQYYEHPIEDHLLEELINRCVED